MKCKERIAILEKKVAELEVRVLNQQTSVVITTNPIQLTDAVSKTILTTLGSDCVKFGSP